MSSDSSPPLFGAALASHVQNEWSVGALLDVRDTVSKWMEAKVIQIDPKKGYFINYIGWSDKWNEWILPGSSRLAPHRAYTVRSTAPSTNQGAYMLEQNENYQKFQNAFKKLNEIITRLKLRIDRHDKRDKFDSDDCLSDGHWQFINSELATQISHVLNALINESNIVLEAVQFFQNFIYLFTQLVRIDHERIPITASSSPSAAAATATSLNNAANNANNNNSPSSASSSLSSISSSPSIYYTLSPSLLDTFSRVLNADPCLTDRRFYLKYGLISDDEQQQLEKEASKKSSAKSPVAIRPKSTGTGDNMKVTSIYLIAFINYFAELNGFELLEKKWTSESNPPNLIFYLFLSNFFKGIKEFLDAKFCKKCLSHLKLDKTLLQRIMTLNDDELKYMSKDAFILAFYNMSDLIITYSKDTKKPHELLDKILLMYFYRCLKCEILEKKIHGITGLVRVVEMIRTRKNLQDANISSQSLFISSKYFVEFIEKENLLQLLVTNDAHEEVIKRSLVILKFLAQNNVLTVDYVYELLNSTHDKHESYIRIIYDIISELTIELQKAHIDSLYARITANNTQSMTESYMQFIKTFTINAVSNREWNNKSLYGFTLFTQLALCDDGINVSPETSQLAMSMLIELMNVNKLKDQRIPLLEKLLSQIQQQLNVIPHLQLFSSILSTFHEFSQHDAQFSRPDLIIALEQKKKLCAIVYDNIEKYHDKAKEQFQTMSTPPDPSTLILQSPHSTHLQSRLNFLEYIYAQSKVLVSTAQIDVLWRVFVTEASTCDDQYRLFEWLTLLITDPYSQQGYRQRAYSNLPIETKLLIFSLLSDWNKMDFSKMESTDYRCFETYFTNINFTQNYLSHPHRKSANTIQIDGMVGLPALWKIVQVATDRKVAFNARSFLATLYCHLDMRLLKHRNSITDAFMQDCLSAIRVESQVLREGKSNQPATCIQLLQTLDYFLTVYEKTLVPNSPTEQHIYAEQSQDILHYPKTLLSNTYFELIFSLLQINNAEIITKVWSLLLKLPKNSVLQHQITDIKPGEVDWRTLFPTSSPTKLLYILQIVHQYINEGMRALQAFEQHRATQTSIQIDQNSTRIIQQVYRWCHSFMQDGGFTHLYSYFISLNLDVLFADSLSQQCISSLLQLFYFFTKSYLSIVQTVTPNTTLSHTFQSLVQCREFIPILLQILHHSVKITPQTEESQSTPDHDCIQYSYHLFTECMSFDPDDRLITSFPHWPAILQLGLLENPSNSVKQQNMNGIQILCRNTDSQPAKPFLNFFIPHLVNMLPLVKPSHNSIIYSKYFDLTANLVRSSPNMDSIFDVPAVVADVHNKIVTHPIIEMRASEEDVCLCGSFILMAALVLNKPELKPQMNDLVKNVYDCLFEMPKASTTNDRDPSAPAPPKCKSPHSRRSGFYLLQSLVSDCDVNLRAFAELFTPLHLISHSGGLVPEEWDFESKAEEKSETGYVGLRNLGCICYMNSTVQQLYMIPSLRAELLQAQSFQQVSNEENVLYQLQYIMAHLQESEKQYCDPMPLCKAFRDFDGNPVNVAIQDDAHGFFGRLIDKVEEQTKGGPHANVFKNALGGMLANQLIGQKCPHRKENLEAFHLLQLEVKNLKTLQDSLKAYVKGEMLEGSNAFKCDKCNAKVDTLRRTVIKDLPNTLVFGLKRFEMDFNTMRTNKLNDYFEFPMKLNMKPYCKESFDEEGKSEGKDNDEAHPAEYYDYVLRGVVVHTGSVDRGHYYSFIQSRVPPSHATQGVEGKWFEFNDILVRPFDPNNIPDECFGGSYMGNNGRGQEVPMEKSRNAYILFYDRVQPPQVDTLPSSDEQLKLQPLKSVRVPVPESIFQQIWSQNLTYWKDRFVYDPSYLDMMWVVVVSGLKFAANMPLTHPSPNSFITSIDSSQLHLHTVLTQLATRFVLETLCRSHSKNHLNEWNDLLLRAYQHNQFAGRWLLHHMTSKWCSEFLISCPLTEVRSSVSRLLCAVMKIIVPQEDKSYRAIVSASTVSAVELDECERYSTCFIDTIVANLRVAAEHFRRSTQYFQVLNAVSQLDTQVVIYLLRKHDFLARLVDFYLAEQSPVPPTTYNMPLNSKGKRPPVSEAPSKPDLGPFLAVLARLVTASQTVAQISNQANASLPPTALVIENQPLLPHSEASLNLFFNKSFLSKLLCEAVTRKRGQVINSIVTHHAWENLDFTQTIISHIANGIKQAQADDLRPYFRIITGLITINDSLQQTRLDLMLQTLLSVMENQSCYWKPTEVCLEHLIRMSKKYSTVYAWLNKNFHRAEWCVLWLQTYATPPKPGSQLLMHKPNRPEPNAQASMYADIFISHHHPIVHMSTATKADYLKLIRSGSPINSHDGSDSDDSEDRHFVVGSHWDVKDTQNKWLVARVIAVDTDRVQFHFDGWLSKWDIWYDINSNRITRFGRFSNGVIKEEVNDDVDNVNAQFKQLSPTEHAIIKQ